MRQIAKVVGKVEVESDSYRLAAGPCRRQRTEAPETSIRRLRDAC